MSNQINVLNVGSAKVVCIAVWNWQSIEINKTEFKKKLISLKIWFFCVVKEFHSFFLTFSWEAFSYIFKQPMINHEWIHLLGKILKIIVNNFSIFAHCIVNFFSIMFILFDYIHRNFAKSLYDCSNSKFYGKFNF